MTYNYEKAVRDDVRRAILDDEYADDISRCGSMNEVIDKLNELMWIDDYVTGNASGTYTADLNKTRSYLVGNEGLIIEAIRAYGSDAKAYENAILNPDFADVNIRCYLLDDAIWDVLEEPSVRKHVQSLIEKKNIRSKNVRTNGKTPRTKKTVKAKSAKGQRTAVKRTVKK